MKKILIIDEFAESLILGVEALGVNVDYMPLIEQTDILQLPNEYLGLVVRSKTKVDTELLNHFSQLRFVARGGAGMDGIDEGYCNEKKIALFNAPEGNRDAVAEQTVAVVLAWYTKLIFSHNEVMNGVWDRDGNRGLEIKNKTIGIIGFGNTGREVAKRWSSFGCTILCYDINKSQYDDTLAKPSSLKKLLQVSDVVSIHIPLLKSNHHFVNSHFISQLKSSSLLVNMSRGEILDTPEVLKSLSKSQFAGLCLDVIEGEQKEGFPKLDVQSKMLLPALKDRIIITPHIAGWTHESYQKIADVILQKITNYWKTYEKKHTK